MRILLILFLALSLTGSSQAQPQQPPPRGQSFERIERLKKMRMVEMLGLTEEQSVRFITRYDEYENSRHDLNHQRDETLDKVEQLLRNKADAKEFEKLFADVESIGRRVTEEKIKFFNDLSDMLSIEQRAKLLLFERRFENELRDAVRQARQRRHGLEDN